MNIDGTCLCGKIKFEQLLTQRQQQSVTVLDCQINLVLHLVMLSALLTIALSF